MRVLLRVSLLLCICAAVAAEEQADSTPRSRAASAAKRKYDDAVAKARQEYSRRLETARAAAMNELREAMKAATRQADLDEANRINAVLGQLDQDAPPPSQGSRLTGRWQVRYGNGVQRVYEIRDDGSATWVATGTDALNRGRFQRSGSNLVFDEGPLAVERWTACGERCFIEHFDPRSSFPNEFPKTIGIATHEADR